MGWPTGLSSTSNTHITDSLGEKLELRQREDRLVDELLDVREVAKHLI